MAEFIGLFLFYFVLAYLIDRWRRRRVERRIEKLEDQLGIHPYYRWANRRNRG